MKIFNFLNQIEEGSSLGSVFFNQKGFEEKWKNNLIL